MLCSVMIRRDMPQYPKLSIQKQIEFIVSRALVSTQGWSCTHKIIGNTKKNNKWVGVVLLCFEKTKWRRDDPSLMEKQWHKILERISIIGSHNKFNKYPWVITDNDATDVSTEEEEILDDTNEKIKDIKKVVPPGVHDVVISGKVLAIDDIKNNFPHDLRNGTDEYIESHEVFRGIFGRGAQIRSILSTIWSFVESNGERANHTLLWGLPACAKTEILLRLIKLFGEGAVLRLDSTSTTRAGLEKLIFKELEVVPPIFISEEIEKADEQFLRIWLGAMDDRHEFRKVNFNQHQVRKVYFLSLATANDKDKFDLMMGGRPGYPGALSSRFIHQLECFRPNENQMRLILKRDIERFGGKLEWIEPCIELARELQTDDPRRVLGFLDGGDRLLTGQYRQDQLIIHRKTP